MIAWWRIWVLIIHGTNPRQCVMKIHHRKIVNIEKPSIKHIKVIQYGNLSGDSFGLVNKCEPPQRKKICS